jgi:FkbM family methyltransferase
MQLSERTLPIAKGLRLARQLLPVPGWTRVFRLAFDPAKQSDFEFEIPLFEGTFVGHANQWVDWCALFHGCYELADITVMRDILSKISDAVALDIGANVGHHSLALAGVAAKVHAFEPYPPRLECLRTNVMRNRHLSITIHPLALGLDDGEASFRLPVSEEWAGVQFDPKGPLRFPIRNGDRYLTEQGIDRVNFIKLDVDGNEFDILRGLSGTIEKWRPYLAMELNDGQPSPLTVLPQGYTLVQQPRCMNVICRP